MTGSRSEPDPDVAGGPRDRELLDIDHLIAAGRNTEARRRAATLAAADPQDWRALSALFQATLALGDGAGALAVADRLLALVPASGFAHRCRAAALQQLGDRALATAAAREATRCDPGDADAWRLLAISAGDDPATWQEAREAGLRAVALAPHWVDAHLALGVAVMDDDPEAARAAFTETLALDPAETVAVANLATLSWRENDLRAAADGYTRLISLDPHHRAPQRFFRYVMTRTLLRLSLLMLGFLAAALPFAGSVSDDGRRGIAGILILLTAAVAIGQGRQLRRTPISRRRYQRTLLRRDPVLRTWAATLAAIHTTAVVSLAGPLPWWQASVTPMAALWTALLLLGLLAWDHRHWAPPTPSRLVPTYLVNRRHGETGGPPGSAC